VLSAHRDAQMLGVKIARDKTPDNVRNRIAAIKEINDRAWGRAPQAVALKPAVEAFGGDGRRIQAVARGQLSGREAVEWVETIRMPSEPKAKQLEPCMMEDEEFRAGLPSQAPRSASPCSPSWCSSANIGSHDSSRYCGFVLGEYWG
jgi:hypothetical protein